MAKRSLSVGGWFIVGLLALGISQCFKTPEPSTTAVARPPPPAASAPSPSTPSPSTPPASSLPANTAPAATSTQVDVRFVTASSLNVRSEPSTSGTIIGKIPNGHQIAVIERGAGWLLVQSAAGGRGWVSEQYTSLTRPTSSTPAQQQPAAVANINRADIVQKIIERSIRNYSGNCPCPYNTDRAGRRCGQRSAYSRPGGRSPICYADQVTEAMIAAFAQ